MDGETLLSQPLDAQPFLVSQLIPQGLHILGGAPKIGKSWLVLWMCLKIAMGEPIWNYETRQGTVLYLALEDSFERLQSRLLEITDEAPSCLHFAVLAKSISDGLHKQIESFIEKYPDTSFIAIDTLQNIRGEDNSANPYANDYPDALTVAQAADASLFSEKALCDAITNGLLHAENVMQIRYISKQKLLNYTKSRISHVRLPLCKLQMELLNKITKERENREDNTKNGRKNDGKTSGCTGCRRRNKNTEPMQNKSE